MNILVCIVADNYSDKWYNMVLSKLKIGNCAVIFRDEVTSENSIVSNRYATHKLFHYKMKRGDYSDFDIFENDIPPIDVDILNSLSQYENQFLWMAERCVGMEFSQKRFYYIQTLRYWNYFLDKLNIDLFLVHATPHEGYNYVIYLLCKAKGIPVITGMPLAYYNRYYLMNDIYDQLPLFPEEYKELLGKYGKCKVNQIDLRKDIREMFDYYTGKEDRTPYYVKKKEQNFSSVVKKFLYHNVPFVKLIVNIKYKDWNDSQTRKTMRFWYRTKLIMNAVLRLFSFSTKTYELFEEMFFKSRVFHEDCVDISFYNNNIVQVDYSRKYIYVALHMQPENTSSPGGGIFVDQALMIEMLSFYLPKDWILYVKEHPAQIEQGFAVPSSYRSLRFYRRLKRCSNVKFVSMQEDTYKLISNSMAVATLTGTAGLEAITQGIPCLMFGYSYLQYAPNVYHIKNNDDCKNALQDITEKVLPDEYYWIKLKLYFKCLEKYVFEASTVWCLLKENEREIAKNALANKYLEQIHILFGSKVFSDS